MEKFKISGKYDKNWALIKENHAEIWGENLSSHPWKDRTYAPQLVRITSPREAMELHKEFLRTEKKKKAEEQAAEEKKEARKAVLSGVAGQYGTFTVNLRGEVEDAKGNFLFSLPNPLPSDIGKWIEEEFEAYLDCGE